MAFVISDKNNSDKVTFYMRDDFAISKKKQTKIIERGDIVSQRKYILKYMNTIESKKCKSLSYIIIENFENFI